MARREIVAERVRRLIHNFDRYVAAYDSMVPFSSDQLASHQATLLLRHQAGSVSAAVADPQFVASLRGTLAAWRPCEDSITRCSWRDECAGQERGDVVRSSLTCEFGFGFRRPSPGSGHRNPRAFQVPLRG